ncbi:MAG TPA: hypothetical protein VI408_07210 [Gaiellaceae bacterium]
MRFPAGAELPPTSGVLLVMQGVLDVDGEERGPGHVVGRWEPLAEARIVAQTDVRVIALDRADWQAAEAG